MQRSNTGHGYDTFNLENLVPINGTLLPIYLWQQEYKVLFVHPQEKQEVPKRSNWVWKKLFVFNVPFSSRSKLRIKVVRGSWAGAYLSRDEALLCLSSSVWEVMNGLKVPHLQRLAGWSVKKVRNLASCFLYLFPSVSATPKMSKHLVMAQGTG